MRQHTTARWPDVPTLPKVLAGGADPKGGSRCVTWHSEQAEDAYGCLAETVSHQLETLYDAGILKRRDSLDVAIDMHLTPRHDKKHGAKLVRSRYVRNQCL